MRMTICLMLFRLALVSSFDLASAVPTPISARLGESSRFSSMAARALSLVDAMLFLGCEEAPIVGNGDVLMVPEVEVLGVDMGICEFEAEARLKADALVGGGTGGALSLSAEEALILGIFDLEAEEEDRFRRPSPFGLDSIMVTFGGFLEPTGSVRAIVPLSRLVPEDREIEAVLL